jgi:hypothetical protein
MFFILSNKKLFLYTATVATEAAAPSQAVSCGLHNDYDKYMKYLFYEYDSINISRNAFHYSESSYSRPTARSNVYIVNSKKIL